MVERSLVLKDPLLLHSETDKEEYAVYNGLDQDLGKSYDTAQKPYKTC